MQVILKRLLVLYVFLLAGWLIGRLRRDKASHADILSVLLVNIFLPCKVFLTFSNNVSVSFLTERYDLLIASVVVLAILAALSPLVSRIMTQNPYERRVYAYSIPIANYAYLGYALIESVFGETVLSEFMFFVIPFSLYTYTVGYILLTGEQKPLKKLLNPITVAIVLGIAAGLLGWKLPDAAVSAVSAASACVGPLSMVLTGLTLSTFAIKELLTDKTAYLFSFLRLVGIPALAYLVCCLLRLDTLMPMILMVTCMPCGLNTIVFPRLIGEDCRTGARLALITHVCALATIPLWLSLIR